MTTNSAEIPATFQQETLTKIQDILVKGRNVQVTGFKGMGKSLILKAITKSPKFNSVFKIYAVDLDMLGGFSPADLKDLVEKEIPIDLASLGSTKEKVVFLIDSGSVNYTKYPEIFNYLKALWNKYRGSVNFVFAFEKPVVEDIFFGEIVIILPMNLQDAEWFWNRFCKFKTHKKEILKASGGIPGIIKRLCEIAEDGEDVISAIENPSQYFRLNYQLEMIKRSLQGEALDYEIPIYNNYIKGGKNDLTKLEEKVYKYLLKSKNETVSRYDLITATWGENATEVADHALDQIIFRLKSKLPKSETIKTIKGRGHKLIISH